MSENKKTKLSRVLNLPNFLTALRIVLAGFFFWLMVRGGRAAESYNYFMAALVVFVLAGLTDFLDGYFARKLGQITVLGRIIDPFADKLMICGTFVVILSIDSGLVDVWLVLIVLGREFVVSAIRTVAESHQISFGAVSAGKIKMAIQFSAGIAFILALYIGGHHAVHSGENGSFQAVMNFLYRAWFTAGFPIAWSMYWVSMIVTISSGIVYLSRGIKTLQQIEGDSDE